MIKNAAIAVVLSVLSLESVADEEDESASTPPSEVARFGKARTFAISGDFSVALQRYEATLFTQTTVTVRPALDYFLVDHLSVGGGVGFAYSGASSTISTQ